MSIEEKLRMARQLERLHVDIIEAGLPWVSPTDFEGVRLIAKNIQSAIVAARCRATKGDIDRAAEALKTAKKGRINISIPVSDVVIEQNLKKTRDQVLEEVGWAVQYARSFCDDVQFACEDALRTDLDFLMKVITTATEAGARTVTLPDTFGYATPEEYGALFRMVRERLTHSPGTVLSAHCHNDLGLAVANSLSALQQGARQVECTINGIGERAGNASLEELVMILSVRNVKFPLSTAVQADELYRTSRLLSNLTGMLVQRNKAIVGANAFAYHPGSDPMAGMMTPQSVGIKHSTILLGKHSDREALRQRYRELGYDLAGEELERAFHLFCQTVEQKKEIFDEDLLAIMEDRVEESADTYHLENIQVHSGTTLLPTATVELRRGDQRFVDSATGDGPVDATYKAIERITGMAGQLMEYSIKSVSLGRDAFGEVFVRVDFNGVSFNGRGLSTDVIAGSAKAYLEALNRAIIARSRKAPEITSSANA